MTDFVKYLVLGQRNLDLMKAQLAEAIKMLCQWLPGRVPGFHDTASLVIRVNDFSWTFSAGLFGEITVVCRYEHDGGTCVCWSTDKGFNAVESRVEPVYDSANLMIKELFEKYDELALRAEVKLNAAKKF